MARIRLLGAFFFCGALFFFVFFSSSNCSSSISKISSSSSMTSMSLKELEAADSLRLRTTAAAADEMEVLMTAALVALRRTRTG